MRKQIAAANWKMNLSITEAEALLDGVLAENISLPDSTEVLFAVPFPYLAMAAAKVSGKRGYAVAAQNCSNKKAGAFTGEVAAPMLASMAIRYTLVGHSERREFYGDTAAIIAEKIDVCLLHHVTPVFCCGEALAIRESGEELPYVEKQLQESLFHLPSDELQKLVIAYEPVWAIGTGRTATTQQAQEMHRSIRSVIAGNWGSDVADNLTILYGGSVKASNAKELFGCADVDGGLVGGASLVAAEFGEIIKGLKQ